MVDETTGPIFNFDFNRLSLNCVVGGVSVLDIPRLNVQSEQEARRFIAAYGYDLENSSHREQLWATHRRAVALIKEQLLEEDEKIPPELYDPRHLSDITQILIYASSSDPGHRERQKWACAILRVMHVFVHSRNDLFNAFRDEIQSQILKPLQDCILEDDLAGLTVLGASHPDESVKLHKYEIKPFKTTGSSVIKLLARPEKVALTLLDKLGVRFVTRSIFDSFQVIRYLVNHHIVSYPHIIPDQSNNTLYPANLFFEVMEHFNLLSSQGKTFTQEQVQTTLKERLETARSRAEFLEKSNEFSGPDYRFIKFINRKLITVQIGDGGGVDRAGDRSVDPGQGRVLRFFYPYEIQIVDYDSYVLNLTGPMAHDEYKARQRRRARARVLGEVVRDQDA